MRSIRGWAGVACGHRVGWILLAMWLACLLPVAAWAQTSTFCPNLTATVIAGSSVQIPVDQCHGGWGLGPVESGPAHGTVNRGNPGTGQVFTYTHNGNAATSDFFSIDDGNGPPNNLIGVTITIVQPTVPSLSIDDVSLAEGDAGTTSMRFTVSLSAPAGAGGVSFSLATANGSAIEGQDYQALSLTGQTIAAGSTTRTIDVQITGDTLQEPNETFFVNISNVTGAVVADGQAQGTIVNDDFMVITPAILPPPQAGVFYDQQLDTTGGLAPYLYSVDSGVLPGGLTLSTSGRVSGIPTATGAFQATLRSADSRSGSAQSTATQNYTFDVAAPTLTLSPGNPPAATAGNAYSHSFQASGGIEPYVYGLAGSLPAGITFHVLSGTLQGIPTESGSFSMTITAFDRSGSTPATVSQNYTLVVMAPALTLDPSSLPTATAGVAYSQTLQASGGILPYSYQIIGSGPPGLTLDSSGTVLGTPTASGTFVLEIMVSDSTGGTPGSVSSYYTVNVLPPTLTLSPGSLSTATAGVAYSQTLQASGGTAPYTYSVSGNLPAGMGFDASTGMFTLSGTPTAAGSFALTISATDSTTGMPGTVSQSYTLVVSAPSLALSPGSLPAATAGMPYSQTIQASGGIAPYTYSVSGNLPQGMTLNSSTRTLSGTPTASGNFTLTVSARDSTTGTAGTVSQSYTLVVSAPSLALSPGSLPTAIAGTAYSQSFQASGGIAPYTYSMSGNLPAGMGFDASTGMFTLSGTPTAAGSFALTISATDSTTGMPGTVSQSYTFNVAAPSLALSPGSLPTATAGSAYSQSFQASGGIAPYTYSVSGSLPAGMGFDTSTGMFTLSGTPTAAGSFALTVSATDSTTGMPGTVSQNLTLEVAAPSLVLTPNSLPAATAGTAYSQSIVASGGTAPYTYSMIGSLPAGISFDTSTGTLSGTPTASGSFALAISAIDSTAGTPGTVSQNLTLEVAAPSLVLTPNSLPAATAGTAYSQSIVASGGIAPYSYSVSGSLPAGMSFDPATGTLSGTPTASGSFALAISAIDSTAGTPGTVSQNLTLEVSAPILALSPGSLPAATAGTAYSQSIVASGGIAPYTYSISGSLPAGMSFDPATGTLSGTPTASGSFALAITASDSTTGTPGMASQNLTLEVAAPSLVLTPNSLPAAIAGTAYSQSIVASGGIAPYTYSVSGSLPAGISFDHTTGLLSGTPTASGSFALAITASDSTTGTAANVVSHLVLEVGVATLELTPLQLADALAGVAYTQVLSVSGGIAPYQYELSGALPAGIVFDPASGTLSGTPTEAGSFAISVSVSDSTAGTAASLVQAYTLQVMAAELQLTPSSLPAGNYGQAYQQLLSVSGGTAPYRYAVTSGSLPSGLQLDPDGEISGLVGADGSFALRITVTDALGFSGHQDYVLLIGQRPDPRQDPDVRGLLSAQAETARRFANSQVSNFQQRMQQLRGASNNGGFSNNLSLVASRPVCDTTIGSKAVSGCDLMQRSPFDAEQDLYSVPSKQRNDQALGMWLGGALRSGRSAGGSDGTDFQTDGLSLGFDYRFTPSWVVGAGVGYGRDRSEVGNRGSRSDAEAMAMVVYASYGTGQHLFVDMLAGHQLLDYSLRRHVTSDGSLVHGRRDGQQWFASLSLGADIHHDDWQITPYIGLETAQGTLDAFAETGNALFALYYGEQDVDTTTGNAGVRLRIRQQAAWGAWTPHVSVEYQHDFSGNGVGWMQYTNTPGLPLYGTALDSRQNNRWLFGAGLQLELRDRWGLRIDYRGLVGRDDRDNGVQLSLDRQL